MKVIYHCYGGSHSSVLAAAIHVGLLDPGRLPSGDDIMRVPYFDKTTDADFGRIRFFGVDEMGNEVYVLGKMSLGEEFNQILTGLARLMGVENNLMVVHTMPHVNLTMMIGGNLSRKKGMPWIGRPIVIRGSRAAFFRLAELVREVKAALLERQIP